MKNQVNERKVNDLVLSAILIAMATLLGMIKFLHLPFGGSITLFSMFFATLCGYYMGTAKGIISGIALGLLNFILGPTIIHPAQVFMDYILAFSALGLSGLTRNRKHGLVTGYLIGVTGRFLISFLSGFIFFASYAPDTMNPAIYSFLYNLTYMGTEAVLTVIILQIPAVRRTIERFKH